MAGRSNSAYLGLGGNIGEPRDAMAAALRELDSHGEITVTAVSRLYRTPPWGKTDQPDFLNACAAVDTSLDARQLLDVCLNVERQLKRVRSQRWGPRTIDIDLLWHSAGPVADEGLTVPHPRMAERAFVLVPLAELAPELVIDGKTIAGLARETAQTGLEVVSGSGWWHEE